MCYLVAKRFEETGCIAIKTKHGKALADITKHLQKEIGLNGVQLVVISRPSAYTEYEPYRIIEDMDIFQKEVLAL